MGIDSISPSHEPSEYRFWDMEEYTSGTLGDGSKKYYLYAKVTKAKKGAKGTFLLSEKAIKIESNDDLTNYYLLVGILNSEYDGERSFVPLYGFTEILAGRIRLHLLCLRPRAAEQLLRLIRCLFGCLLRYILRRHQRLADAALNPAVFLDFVH